MKKIPIYSIVAYSGTGKTTLLERLIPEIKSYGLRVAVIKHDAHDFEIDREGKDSWRFTQSGADVVAIASGTKAAVIENRQVSFDRLIERITDVDLILTEGYKHGPWPKIALFRQESGNPLPLPPDSCFAVLSDAPIETTAHSLALDDIPALAQLIIRDAGFYTNQQ